MWFRSLFDSLPRSPRHRQKCAAHRKQQARRLLLEGLEDRRVMAFVPAVTYPAGDSPNAVVAADFNSDGQLDLATAHFSSNSVSVLLGNADGTFQLPLEDDPKKNDERSKLRVRRFSPERLLRRPIALAGGVTVSVEKHRGRKVVRLEEPGESGAAGGSQCGCRCSQTTSGRRRVPDDSTQVPG
jgi:hypothetical protein